MIEKPWVEGILLAYVEHIRTLTNSEYVRKKYVLRTYYVERVYYSLEKNSGTFGLIKSQQALSFVVVESTVRRVGLKDSLRALPYVRRQAYGTSLYHS